MGFVIKRGSSATRYPSGLFLQLCLYLDIFSLCCPESAKSGWTWYPILYSVPLIDTALSSRFVWLPNPLRFQSANSSMPRTIVIPSLTTLRAGVSTSRNINMPDIWLHLWFCALILEKCYCRIFRAPHQTCPTSTPGMSHLCFSFAHRRA